MQSQDGEKVRQATMVQTAPEPLANGQTILERTTNGEVTTRVVTDTIGTPTTDFVKYGAIKTDQKSATGEALDFRDVIGVWGRTEPTGDLTNGQLYGESVLGIIPTAKLTVTERAKLMKMLKDQNVFSSKKATATTSWYGRVTYSYALEINARAYITVMKEYARTIGLNHLETLNPETYPAEQKITATVSVDSWSRQLTNVVYAGGERNEAIVGHNSVRALDGPPNQAISISELQQRLQQ